MKRIAVVASLLIFAGSMTPAASEESILESVAQGCEQELTDFCGEVTVGEGRVLACLYAYGDQLSGQCEYALYDAAVQLDQFVGAMTYLASECAEDLDTHCASVAMGEGRLAKCLLDNESQLQDRCSAAIDTTNLQVQ